MPLRLCALPRCPGVPAHTSRTSAFASFDGMSWAHA